MQLHLQHHSSILEIDQTDWNALAKDSPFLRYEFLSALENSGCIGNKTAWEPAYITVADKNSELLGALPLYIKYDSQGEFVFDWSWANAYEQAGISYYPKLISAVPFTPATGKRILVRNSNDFQLIAPMLLKKAKQIAEEINASSLHILFPSDTERHFLSSKGLLQRKNCQFHWHNREYNDFDDFLKGFVSVKRKKVRRERRRIYESGIRFEHLLGDQVSEEDWEAIFDYYSLNFIRRGRAPYLNRKFFKEIAQTMPESILIILARFENRAIATAICFQNQNTLYGRYWGSLADFHSLHFETCYYQGIEYCIRKGINRFEPGTQGEHKLSRGFTPIETWSNHWINDPLFEKAIAQFVNREEAHINEYIKELMEHVPYRNNQRSIEPKKQNSL